MSGYPTKASFSAEPSFLAKMWGWITFIPIYIWGWVVWVLNSARNRICVGDTLSYIFLIVLIGMSVWAVPLLYANIFQAKFAPKRDCSTCPGAESNKLMSTPVMITPV